jgi:hypothetical protein
MDYSEKDNERHIYRSLEHSKKMSQNARNTNSRLKPDGYIYILQYGKSDIYKIGVSARPKRRIQDIDNASPFPVKKILTAWFKDVYEMEEIIHKNLENVLIRKEWFRLDNQSLEQVKSVIVETSEIMKELKIA